MRKMALTVGLLTSFSVAAQTSVNYQKPPAPIEQLLDAPRLPVVTVSPDHTVMLIEQPADFPTIADLAQPRYRLAGLRFNPVVTGPSSPYYDVDLHLQNIVPGKPTTISGLPAGLRATAAIWSPDSKHIAFLQRAEPKPTEHKTGRASASSIPEGAGLQLWVIDVPTAGARRLGRVHVNAILGTPCSWLPDSSGLLCKIVPAGRGNAPKASDVPAGPNVSENLGKVTPAPTYEDMLKTPGDETVFEFYAQAELAEIHLNGPMRMLPVKGMIESASASPDGRFVLAQTYHRPFSYTVPYEAFPQLTQVVTLATGASKTLNDRPLIDDLPIARDAVEAGPRDYQWRSDVPATLVWMEAANGGVPDPKAPIADSVKALTAPFDTAPVTLLEAPMRLADGRYGAQRGIVWGNDHLALATVSRFADRRLAMLLFDPSSPGKVTTLYAGSSQDRHHLPGAPVTVDSAAGFPLLKLSADRAGIYFVSPGAGPAGDQPYISVMSLAGGAAKILFRSSDPYYAEPVALLSDTQALVRRESQTESPNYFVATLSSTLSSTELTRITDFPSPYAGIQMPTHQLLKYKRADGVDLTATLWLPHGYDKSQGPLPTLMEAYPAEFKTRAAASQVAGSPNRFPRVTSGTPIFFTQTGYAVLQNAAIPIIGEGDQQPNDTYVEQLVAGAKAAVNCGVAMGVVDPRRVAVMGHSYGAFMTANLLAHSTMFRAGIARSGAYNRSLTPYGFQNEERTYWQAPQVYNAMSPFNYADKIKTPILLIHGEADDNTGTYPIQSERFYAALKGQGATVRLVFLPLEAHGYVAHESLQHMLWEMNRWLDTYVKPAAPAVAGTGN